ncbi:decaprenyl-diphosphate synthase subunit 1 isoform X5 [Phycodurus eques]|uniref:decaprenyl-diphosphate synthase subunit 1 isoform X5 n=1 Tax=Phycodurus eques TaxID=693459 RepID=UPI002ACD75AE|nr:decaprenyl-diphosphate synthase subunit 1 isoform X5 [Phycodurus eques]
MANMAAGPLWRRYLRWTVGRAAASLREAEWHLFRLRSASGAATSPGRASCKRWRPDETQLPYLQLNKKILQRSTSTSLSLARHKYPRCSCRTIHSDAKPKDPFTLAQKDLKSLYDDIKKELFVSKEELKSLCDYYFDGKGKAIRPMIVILMARALNIHSNRAGVLLPGQRAVAMISEMIHTASLVHDDVIDGSDERRGKRTINHMWGERKAILVGDFILSAASMALARIGDIAVVKVLAQVTEDLVRVFVCGTQASSCSWAPRRTRASGSSTTWTKPSRRRPASSPTVAKQCPFWSVQTRTFMRSRSSTEGTSASPFSWWTTYWTSRRAPASWVNRRPPTSSWAWPRDPSCSPASSQRI